MIHLPRELGRGPALGWEVRSEATPVNTLASQGVTDCDWFPYDGSVGRGNHRGPTAGMRGSWKNLRTLWNKGF